MALTDPRRRNLMLAAAVILLAWLAPVEAGRPPALAQQPPPPAQTGMLAYTATLGDGVVCQIVFPIVDVERVRMPDGRIGTRMVPVNNNGFARNEAELKDMNDVIAVFANALKSDDMQKKVREACVVHQRKNPKGEYQFLVGLTRNDPDLMTGLQLSGVNQLAVDLADVPQIADHLSGGSQAARDVVSNNWLTSVLAHEFDHARDGPTTTAHRDPEGQCASDPQNPGEPTKDQNAVIADLQLGHTRVQYTYPAADGTTATDFNVTINGQTETVTLNVTSLTGATFTDQPMQAASPPSQPQTAGPPAPQPAGPPAPPQPAGPPAPPRQPAGPPAPPRQHSGANHMLGIPEQACGGATTTGCFGPAGAGDGDFDGVPNTIDNCPAQANPQQGDRNGNGIGDACDRSMPPCSAGWSFTDPKVYGSIGGAVLGGFLIAAGGGDTPTATGLTPNASPAPAPAPAPAPTPTPTPTPTPEPTPAPTPAPPPRTTADGRYRCVAVRIVNDEGRHNSTINLGPQLTGDFDVREGNGTITIRHPAPFVDIVNAQFDPVTGRFSGTAVGAVAGSPNVGVRAEGTVNTTTGQIVFTYTMGTGGELPGGRPIVYEITLQKQ